jgi:3-hydroxy-9,10-secoandrosta-1,3,5(10)-triene-9,17-dione monooxygenase
MRSTAAEVIERARGLAADFRAAAPAGERDRRIPRESVRKMLDGGLARVLVPRRFGGYELDLTTWFEVTRELARADAAHGWCAGLMVHNPHYATYFPLAGQEEIWADGPDFCMAGGLAPVCAVERVEGGYVVSGRSPFASGVLHSAWSSVGGFLPEAAEPRRWAWFLVPAAEYEVADTWHTIAMRGTGSNTIVTDGVFVPDARVAPTEWVIEGSTPGPRPSENPMYRLPIAAFGALGFATTILGTAQGALAEYLGWTRERVTPAGARIAERQWIQRRAAEVAANIDAAEALLRRTIELAESGAASAPAARARTLRDYAHAAHLCGEAIDDLIAISGTSAFGETSVIGRAWRDIHFMATNLGIAAEPNYTHWGRLELGLDRDPAMAVF